MDKVKLSEEIFKIYTNLIYESCEINSTHIDYDITQLDSLGIIKFVIEIEDTYSINLDALLVTFRDAKDIYEIIDIVHTEINKQTTPPI